MWDRVRWLFAPYRSLAVAMVAITMFGCGFAVILCDNVCAQYDTASYAAAAPQLVDGWRRTAQGWEWLPASGEEKNPREVPSEHVAVAQVWPAAWAACVVLSVFGLAAAGAEGKEIDACLAAGDQVGYDLRRAA